MFVQLLVVMLAGMAPGTREPQPSRGLNLYSLEKEAALGAQLAEDFRRVNPVLDNAMVRGYVERLGGQIAAELPAGGGTYIFDVIAGPTNQVHEPVSVPGGSIFVPAALFPAAQDEAEFAGMLAHAMAHIAARHGTRMASRAGLSGVPLLFVFPGPGSAVRMGGAAAKVPPSIPPGFLAFVRGYESEADRLAAQAMARAGYDPAALLRFIQRVQVDPTKQPKVSWALPSREARVANLEKIIGQLPARTYSSSDEYQRVRDEVRASDSK